MARIGITGTTTCSSQLTDDLRPDQLMTEIKYAPSNTDSRNLSLSVQIFGFQGFSFPISSFLILSTILTGIRIEQYLATTKDFRGMSLSNRKCLYQDEQRLKWFPNYSEGNCILECGWNNAAKTCGCVPWYLKEYFPVTRQSGLLNIYRQ